MRRCCRELEVIGGSGSGGELKARDGGVWEVGVAVVCGVCGSLWYVVLVAGSG